MTLLHWVTFTRRFEQTQCLHSQGSNGRSRKNGKLYYFLACRYLYSAFCFNVACPIALDKRPLQTQIFYCHCRPTILKANQSTVASISSRTHPLRQVRYTKCILFILGRCGPTHARASSFLRFLDHTQTHHSRHDSSGQVISSSQRPLPDKYITFTRNRHPCHPRDSNRQSLQASSRPMSQTLETGEAYSLGHINLLNILPSKYFS